MEDTRTIIIDLDNSLYAHAFTSEQQIHQEDLDKALHDPEALEELYTKYNI